MYKRQLRLKREFIYNRSVEIGQQERKKKKLILRTAISEGKPIPKELSSEALSLNEELDWSDDGADNLTCPEDDEYYSAGKEDPNVVITTSRSPSTKLKEFAKELRFLIPNATKINRGNYHIKEMVDACLSKQITDLIIVNETRGVPDSLIVSHFPFGPTAKFTLYNFESRDDLQEKPDSKMPQTYPNHIFHGMNTKLGMRVRNILRYMFPVPREESRRLVTWFEEDDIIRVRHHTFKYENKKLQVSEHGPRFDLRLYKIWRASLHEEKTADIEWVFKPYMNTTYKRRFLGELQKEDEADDVDEDEHNNQAIDDISSRNE